MNMNNKQKDSNHTPRRGDWVPISVCVVTIACFALTVAVNIEAYSVIRKTSTVIDELNLLQEVYIDRINQCDREMDNVK